ncbi:MAG: tripartite tricarboxylate transporter TctB family protein [Paracoccaceae bacterium]|uniref:tripartite tricarboxylate transporter TctB family protein n=1 Tax=Alphaproteobacteria TaxID=28211 RepID=UPI003263E48E
MFGRLNSSIIVGTGLALFGLLAGWFSLQIPAEADGRIGARIFPYMGAGALFLLGGLELCGGMRKSGGRQALTDHPMSILSLLALAILYVWLITKLGYLIGTGLIAPLVMWLFGIRNPFALLAAAILCPGLYHYIFFELLGVFPPYGEWFDLLDVLQGS